MSRLPAGWAATGSSRLPSRNGIVQELGLRRVEVTAAAFVPRRRLYRWAWTQTPRLCSRSESKSWWRGQSWPSRRKSTRTGEPTLGQDPGGDLLHAGKARGAGSGAGGGVVFALKFRIKAAGNDQVVPVDGGMNAHELRDAFPAQPEPVHQHPFRVRSAPQPPVHNGHHPATATPGQ